MSSKPSAMDKLALDFTNKLIAQDEKEEEARKSTPQSGPVAAANDVTLLGDFTCTSGAWIPVRTYSEDKTTYTVEMIHVDTTVVSKHADLLPEDSDEEQYDDDGFDELFGEGFTGCGDDCDCCN